MDYAVGTLQRTLRASHVRTESGVGRSTYGPLASRTPSGDDLVMKRLAVSVLWLYTGWYAGSMIAAMLGVPDLIGPIVGIAAGLLVAFDPRHIVWDAKASANARARLSSLSSPAPN
jgi:hypothetical protein